MNIGENLKVIKNNISLYEQKSGRESGSVKLMAVSKFHPVEEIKEAVDNGQLLFGENRVQEAVEKFEELYKYNPNIELHIIGSLQTNKVKNAVKIAKCIESVDRFELLQEIEKQCAKINKNMEVLFEYHTGEESKSGFTSEEDLFKCLDYINEGNCPHVIPRGFMTMAPFTEDKELIKASFKKLREIAGICNEKYTQFKMNELSMGMSGDYELAIGEGSTLVRVGTAIFGERNYNK